MKMFMSLVFAAAVCATPFVAGAKSHKAEPTKEQRAQMAEMHTKMADCLKSEKPMKDCRSEMMKTCEAHHEDGMCPMMAKGGGHKHGHGMMGHDHDKKEEEKSKK